MALTLLSTDPSLLLFFLFLLVSLAAAAAAFSPATFPVSSSSASLDPKQVRALQSLNVPTGKDPCALPSRAGSLPAVTCDNAEPFRHLVTLTLYNCSSDVALSYTALKSLATLTSLSFIDCPSVSLIRFPSQLTSNLLSFTCIRSLMKMSGVWLNRMKNLTALTVSHTSITASGPWIALSGKKFLNSVTLSQANLSGHLPNFWHPNLTYIDLSGNHLTGRIPFSLTRLENLAHLNLSSNSLADAIPSTIGDLSALQNLSLSSNSLLGPIPASLSALPELEHLDLSNNQLNGTIPNFIRDMKKLKYLDLANNNFRGVLPFNATFVKGLEVFRVGQNSNLCYNHTSFSSKVKLGIAPCDKHGLPMSPPPAKEKSSSGNSADSFDYNDYGTQKETKQHHKGPNKFVLGVAIALSSIVFLIVFLILIAKCCK